MAKFSNICSKGRQSSFSYQMTYFQIALKVVKKNYQGLSKITESGHNIIGIKINAKTVNVNTDAKCIKRKNKLGIGVNKLFSCSARTWTLPKPFLTAQTGLMPSTSASKLSNLFPSQDPAQGDTIPEPVLFVEDLADRLATDFPDLWKLGQVNPIFTRIDRIIASSLKT